MFLNVITRERQVLSSNRCVVSGRARGCGEADAGVVRAAVECVNQVQLRCVWAARSSRRRGDSVLLQVVQVVQVGPCAAAAMAQQQYPYSERCWQTASAAPNSRLGPGLRQWLSFAACMLGMPSVLRPLAASTHRGLFLGALTGGARYRSGLKQANRLRRRVLRIQGRNARRCATSATSPV